MDLEFICCPICNGKLVKNNQKLSCRSCRNNYPIINDIPILLKQNTEKEKNPLVWDQIWKQDSTKKRCKELFKKIEIYLEFSKLLEEPLKKINLDNMNILELGCGGSPFFYYLQKKFKKSEIWGMDRSIDALHLLKNNIHDITSSHIICGDLFNSPLKSKKFDIVCSFGFIEHFHNPKKALEIHADFLKPGGLLICLIPNLYGIPGKILDFIGSDTITTISIKGLHEWFNDIGFKKNIVKPVGGLHPSLFLESYTSSQEKINEKIFYFLQEYLINPFFILLNTPLMFRVNSKMFSPFILSYVIKSKGKELTND
jgi:SAM-dependent methyltransferase